MKFTTEQWEKVRKLHFQYQNAITKAPNAQREAFTKMLDQGFGFRELGSRGGFLLKKGENHYRWIAVDGKVDGKAL